MWPLGPTGEPDLASAHKWTQRTLRGLAQRLKFNALDVNVGGTNTLRA
jgi:hypothetical protein